MHRFDEEDGKFRSANSDTDTLCLSLFAAALGVNGVDISGDDSAPGRHWLLGSTGLWLLLLQP